MQIPYRKPGKYTEFKPDPLITKSKFDELTHKLEHLKNVVRPNLASEVSRLAELGDFSENAEYQLAKGKLRGVNTSILKIEHHLKHAQIIDTQKNSDTVEIGSTVTIQIENRQFTYQILGSSETNPQKGIISYTSPVGAALLNHEVGDLIKIKLGNKEVEYKIIKIE